MSRRDSIAIRLSMLFNVPGAILDSRPDPRPSAFTQYVGWADKGSPTFTIAP